MLKLSHKKIQFCVFFSMMWVFYSLNSRYLGVPKAELMRWVVMAVLVLIILARNQWKIRKPPFLIGLFIIATAPSLLSTINLRESIVKMVCFIVTIYGGYVYFSSLESEEEFKANMRLMMIVIILFEVQSVLAIILGLGYGSGGDRATGITTNANTLGNYSNLALIASFYWVKKSAKIKKYGYLILILCSIWTCLLSGSRGAFAVMVLMIVIVLMFRVKNNFTRVIIFICLLILVKAMFSGSLSFLNIGAVNRLAQKEGTSRGEIWEFGMNVWKQYPIFGCGYSVSNLHNTLEGMKGFDFHNSYITILAETGVWGVSILGIIVLSTLLSSVFMLKDEVKKEPCNIFLINCLMMIVQLVSAYSESFLFAVGSTEACTFWMLFTWNMAYQNFRQEKKGIIYILTYVKAEIMYGDNFNRLKRKGKGRGKKFIT